MDAYIISLPGHETRRDKVAVQLQGLGLTVCHAPGVVASTAPGKCTNAGEYGCTLAHYEILRTLTSPALITEDDVELRRDLHELPNLKPYPMVLLGSTQYEWAAVRIRTGQLGDHYYANHKSNGTFAYYVTPGIARTVVHLIESGHIDAMDRLYKRYIYPEHSVPVCYPNLAIANVSTSDIRKPRDRDSHARRTRWILADYH